MVLHEYGGTGGTLVKHIAEVDYWGLEGNRTHCEHRLDVELNGQHLVSPCDLNGYLHGALLILILRGLFILRHQVSLAVC